MSRTKEQGRAADEDVCWDALRPVRTRESVERTGEGGETLVTLLVPRFKMALFQRISDALKIQPYRLNLDRLGSQVWQLCDGERRFGEICRELAEQYPDEDKFEERLKLYFGQLARGNFVELRRD